MRKAKWIKHSRGTIVCERRSNGIEPIGYQPEYECDNCGAGGYPWPYNYCPTCGRKMINGLDTEVWEDIPDADGEE